MKVDSWLINLPKNAIQYFIGFSLFILTYGYFDLVKLIIGLSAFLISYSSIYFYNDLMDYESDKHDKFKKHYKALVRGDLKQRDAISLIFILIITGLLLSTLINTWYTVLLIILLLQNFLHSSPYTSLIFKRKTAYVLINMFIMQSIKFSLGWLTFTTNLTLLPYWIITTLSLSYLWGYRVYKKGIKSIKKSIINDFRVMLPLSISVIASYIISIIIYPFKLPLLILIFVAFLFLIPQKEKNVVNKTFKLSGLTILILLVFNLLFLSLNVPVIAKINNNASLLFDKISNITLSSVSNNTYKVLIIINNTLYTYPIHDLKEFNDLFNASGKLIIINPNK